MSDQPSLKLRTARAVKWNTIDRFTTQILYAVTGVVLAWLLDADAFGLVGVTLIFQAFASLLIDSGFSYALIQKKQPTHLDYSTVLWFNLAVAATMYVILFFSAPLIAMCFKDDVRLIPISRVIFLALILNASAIVQQNRFVKQMHVRPVATANIVSLVAGGAVGIALAFAGYGAWAVVWQSLTNAGVKSAMLWIMARWVPRLSFSWEALKGFFRVGGSMMFTSTLNTFFQYIYSFIIGNRTGMVPLGYYTQGDKWSKMGVMSIMQTLTSSFLPTLSAVQDEPERFRHICSKINRITAYVTLPTLMGLAVMAPAIFHSLFGTKWDLSIGIFQLLLIRGVFTVLTGVYNNHIVALGHSRLIMSIEIVRDVAVIVALAAVLPFITLQGLADALHGIRVLLWGQVGAAAFAWIYTLLRVSRATGATAGRYLLDILPYAALTVVAVAAALAVGSLSINCYLTLILQCVAGATIYFVANALLSSRIQSEIFSYIFHRK